MIHVLLDTNDIPHLLFIIVTFVIGHVERILLSNAKQSSTNFAAPYAIDKDTDGFGSTTGCAETDNHHNVNWWQGKFDRIYMNIRMRLMPRNDCCKGRYTRVKVFVGTDGYTWELCEDLGNSLKTSNTWVDANCPKYMKAKYVKVALHNKERFALCELEAWGLPLGNILLYSIPMINAFQYNKCR